MGKITIEIDQENIKTVLLILENLKEGLINNISVDEGSLKRQSSYQPRENKVVKEGEVVKGKYLDKNSYKKRLGKS